MTRELREIIRKYVIKKQRNKSETLAMPTLISVAVFVFNCYVCGYCGSNAQRLTEQTADNDKSINDNPQTKLIIVIGALLAKDMMTMPTQNHAALPTVRLNDYNRYIVGAFYTPTTFS